MVLVFIYWTNDVIFYSFVLHVLSFVKYLLNLFDFLLGCLSFYRFLRVLCVFWMQVICQLYALQYCFLIYDLTIYCLNIFLEMKFLIFMISNL